MIVVKWYGAFQIKNGKVVKELIFPEKDRVEILQKIRNNDFTFLKDFNDEEIIIEGEIKSKNDLISTAIQLAKREMKQNLNEDYILIETLNTYDDVISMINLITERLIEWDKIKEIREEDMDTAEDLRKELLTLTSLKEKLSKKIENLTEEICPNIAYLVGPIIAARLISSAGGLSRLARLPASTIQVLGAEESFFRHLKSGSKCPKHGIIFRVPEVRNTSRNMRGKVARSLAAKLAIAAKVDYYKGEFIGDKLKKDLEKRINEVTK